LGERERVDVQVLAEGDVLRGSGWLGHCWLLSKLLKAWMRSSPRLNRWPIRVRRARCWPMRRCEVFLTASASATSRVLVSAIQAWVERDRHRLVRVTMGKRTIEIPSQPTAAQERLVEAFLREVER